MAALNPNRRNSAPARSSVRFPRWAMASLLSGRMTPQGSPDSMGKRTVQTILTEDEESLALPRMEARRYSLPASSALFKMDVTGFRVEDLHVDVDTVSKKLCLAGKGPRMFKRSIPLPAYEQSDISRVSASVVEDNGRKILVLQATAGAAEDSMTVNSQGRRSISIKDETRPPLTIEVPGN